MRSRPTRSRDIQGTLSETVLFGVEPDDLVQQTEHLDQVLRLDQDEYAGALRQGMVWLAWDGYRARHAQVGATDD
jgi:hypothetical protein